MGYVVIIAGSRDCSQQEDFELLESKMDTIINVKKCQPQEIISGGAYGADKLGERFANKNSIPIKLFLPDWGKYNKAAGPIRNKEMGKYASNNNGILIVIWDGKSKGTKSMINYAKSLCIPIFKIIPERYLNEIL